MARTKAYAVGIALTGAALAAMVWSAGRPGHGMAARLVAHLAVVADAAFGDVAGWLRSGAADGQPDWASAAQDVWQGDADRGAALMVHYGCGSCHVIPGVTGARGSVGPGLGGFADRAYVGGVLPNEPAGLVRWLIDPPLHSPQTAMPDLGVDEADARDMAAYLYTLRGG